MDKQKKLVVAVAVVVILGAIVFALTRQKKTETAEVKPEATPMDVKVAYEKNCAQCHRADLGGDLGPNLTDDYWISGNTLADVEKAIVVGNPDRGMPAYGSVLSAEEIKAIVTLIQGAQGSNPAKAKVPQGFGQKLKVQ